MSRQKLELTWVGKDRRPKLESRILREEPENSYHSKGNRKGGDIFDNMLIFGDNLLALKALEARFSGRISVYSLILLTIREALLLIMMMALSIQFGSVS